MYTVEWCHSQERWIIIDPNGRQYPVTFRFELERQARDTADVLNKSTSGS